MQLHINKSLYNTTPNQVIITAKLTVLLHLATTVEVYSKTMVGSTPWGIISGGKGRTYTWRGYLSEVLTGCPGPLTSHQYSPSSGTPTSVMFKLPLIRFVRPLQEKFKINNNSKPVQRKNNGSIKN